MLLAHGTLPLIHCTTGFRLLGSCSRCLYAQRSLFGEVIWQTVALGNKKVRTPPDDGFEMAENGFDAVENSLTVAAGRFNPADNRSASESSQSGADRAVAFWAALSMVVIDLYSLRVKRSLPHLWSRRVQNVRSATCINGINCMNGPPINTPFRILNVLLVPKESMEQRRPPDLGAVRPPLT